MPAAPPPLRLRPWGLAVLAAAALGGVGSAGATTIYAELVKPAWAPPVWLFGPAWTVLYAMMAIAAARVARVDATGRRAALVAWWTQLALNVGWTWCFFVLREGRLAVAEAALLWLAVGGATALAWRVDRIAGLLLVPYAAWVTYAVALTWSVVAHTPGL